MSKRSTIHTKRNITGFVLAVLLLMQFAGFGQLTVSIANQQQCEGNEILVPVFVSDFNGVSSFMLHIEIDTDQLEFVSVVNANSLLAGGSLMGGFTGSNNDSYIIVSWQRLSPVTIGSGKLFDLKLLFNEGPAVLSFRDDCEIALSDLTVVDDAQLNDGIIDAVEIEIITQPQSQTIDEETTVYLTIEQNGATDYQWQINTIDGWNDLSDDDVFSGVTAQQLIIKNVSMDLNGSTFRCMLSVNDCSLASDEATLMVNSVGIAQSLAVNPEITVFPNPFNDKLNFNLSMPLHSYNVRMVNLLGKTVYHTQITQMDITGVETIQTEDLQPGLYFLQLLSNNNVLITVKVLKK